jgi:hypothetical protein
MASTFRLGDKPSKKKCENVWQAELPLTFNGLHGFISQKTELFNGLYNLKL